MRKNLIDRQGSLEIAVLSKRHPKSLVAVALLLAVTLNLLGSVLLTVVPEAKAETTGPQTNRDKSSQNSSQVRVFSAADFVVGSYSSAQNLQSQSSFPLIVPTWFSSRVTEWSARLDNRQPMRPPAWSGNWANFGLFTSQPVLLDQPFNTVKATWNALTPTGTAVELDVRASLDGQHWTLWNVQTKNGSVAAFDSNSAYQYMQYRARLFSRTPEISPLFKGVQLEANVRDFSELSALNIAAAASKPSPTYQVYATREGLVGGVTANGHTIVSHDHFVSLPSWTALNEPGKYDYQVRITTPSGVSVVAPVWDCGPWNFHDDYWHSPRHEFTDIAVGVPEAEPASLKGYNGGVNEAGAGVYNPSGIDIADGTFWDDLKLGGASTSGKVSVTFLWEGSDPNPAPPAAQPAPPAPAPTSKLEIANRWVSQVSRNSATVKWQSGAPATAWLEYGFTSAYGASSAFDSSLNSGHSLSIYSLTPGQTYHYRVHSKDANGNEVVSGDGSFNTAPGATAGLAAWQNDKGIQVIATKNFDKLIIAGGRVNDGYWNDNATENYNAGASTDTGALNPNGDLDFDLVPQCINGHCAFGAGSGYKAYVKFNNSNGDAVRIGIIHSVGLSEKTGTLMVEGSVGGQSVTYYFPADWVDTTKQHHFHVTWFNSQLFVTFDYSTHLNPIGINGKGAVITFVGAARAKGDIIAANFNSISFGDGTLAN